MNTNSNLSRTSEMQIGKVTYIVTSHFKEGGSETAEDKLFRLVSDRITEEMKSGANPLISTLNVQ